MITKDLLQLYGVTQSFLNLFVDNFPNGFEWTTIFQGADEDILQLIDYLADKFSYTGAYVCTNPLGNMCHINYINGKRNDNKGSAGYIEYDFASNVPVVMEFYINGRLQNPVPCKPAVIAADEFGNMSYRSFWDNGLLNDPSKGIAALAYYDSYGNLEEEIHYIDGIEVI